MEDILHSPNITSLALLQFKAINNISNNRLPKTSFLHIVYECKILVSYQPGRTSNGNQILKRIFLVFFAIATNSIVEVNWAFTLSINTSSYIIHTFCVLILLHEKNAPNRFSFVSRNKNYGKWTQTLRSFPEGFNI